MRRKRVTVITIGLSLLLLLMVMTPVLAAQKISNPDRRGGIDGIDENQSIGVHNSYAWCSELFKQNDSDYLWVGMNRDLGAFLFGAADTNQPLLELLDVPEASEDQAGKIYRQRVSDPNAEWELVYDNPAINGYRRMILFKGDLYVLAGLTNRKSRDEDYSLVLRFARDFQKGDAPDIVFWENVTGATTEYFRSATVLGDKLYIGTFDSKIYATDGSGLQNLTPNSSPKDTGWTKVLNFSQYPEVPAGGAIWDLLAFNGSIYAFVAFSAGTGYTQTSPFAVYKINPADASFTQIVGDASAPYPYGMGLPKNMTASGFVSTSFDKDYVYVSTFANGPAFIVSLMRGNYEAAFDNLFCPAQIYRFDKQDNWETVVGDTSGEFVAKNRVGAPLPYRGNQRAGFFLQDNRFQNVSFNQYVWWMAEHEGKLYATTWDMGILKQYHNLLTLTVFNNISNQAVSTLIGQVTEIENQLEALIENYESVNMKKMASELGGYLKGIKDDIHEGRIQDADEIIGGYIAILTKSFPSANTVALAHSLLVFANELRGLGGLDPRETLTEVLAYISSTTLFFADKSNPAGFDLFVSDDGVNFQPVTVNGFGDPTNYGGRVLVSSGHGLYVTTANPFNGAQVWRLTPMELGIYPNGPAEASLRRDDEVRLTVLVTGAKPGDDLQMRYTGDLVDVQLEKRAASKTVTDITWDNQIQITPVIGLKTYSVTEEETLYETTMYDVIITPKKSGRQDVTLSFDLDGASAQRTIALSVSLDNGGGGSGGGTETTGPSLPPLAASWPFIDVGNTDWFYDAVSYVYNHGLMLGTSANRFSPNVAMSRAMLVTVLYRAEDEPAASGGIPFPDVKKGEWYSDAILWASKNGIVLGYANGTFGPNHPVTREQAVTILYRYAKFKGIDISAPSADLARFADGNTVSDWAKDALQWAVAMGIIKGRTPTTIVPEGSMTRAELATILARFLEAF